MYSTRRIQEDIAAFLGDVKLSERLWTFMRRRIIEELLNAHPVHFDSIGTFFFKFRPGRSGIAGWQDDRLIIKFTTAASLAAKFHESQSRGRGKRLLEELKKQPRRGDPHLSYKYTRVAVRKPPFGAKLAAKSASQSALQECSDPPSTGPSIRPETGKNSHSLQETNSSGGSGTSSDQKSGSENTSASS